MGQARLRLGDLCQIYPPPVSDLLDLAKSAVTFRHFREKDMEMAMA
jgi:hypothetical protein